MLCIPDLHWAIVTYPLPFSIAGYILTGFSVRDIILIGGANAELEKGDMGNGAVLVGYRDNPICTWDIVEFK